MNYKKVLAALKTMRVRVPRDVGVVTLERREREAGLSGMEQNFERIGAAAVNSIIGMLHRGERGLPAVPEKILVDASWIEGDTLPHRAVVQAKAPLPFTAGRPKSPRDLESHGNSASRQS